MKNPVRHILPCLLLLIAAGGTASAQEGQAELRDISVSLSEQSSTIRFTISREVRTVVVERVGTSAAQVRIRPLHASAAALKSARLKDGIRSITAHIERRDVLVTNVRFGRKISKLRVGYRKGTRLDVVVSFDDGQDETASKDKPRTDGKSPDKSAVPVSPYLKLRPTIIIDAGHGGKDPGAIGIGGLKEKNVTLAAARLLRKQIRKEMPRAKIIMTRSTDVFVSLERRRLIAQSHRATMWISLHCNSMPDKPNPANGCECYVVRTESNDDLAEGKAREVTEESSWQRAMLLSVAKALPPAGAKHAVRSRQLAALICASLGKTAPIADRGVRRAGFYVLMGSPMPSVLVELGYVTNPQESAVLKSASGQDEIARGISNGIGRYLLAKKR